MTSPLPGVSVPGVPLNSQLGADRNIAADPHLVADPHAGLPQQWRRLNTRMLLIHPVRELIRALPGLAGLFLAGRSSGNGHWWSLIGVAVIIALSISRWATTSYRITPEQVQLRSGLLRRKISATPADRVRTVDVTAHALHRALGLAKVEIGTGISDRKKERLVLDGLTSEAAHSLRAELLHRGAAHKASPASRPAAAGTVSTVKSVGLDSRYVAGDSETELLRLNPAWIRFAPFTLSGALTGLALLGFGWRIVSQAHVDARKIGAVESTSRHLSDTPLWLDVIQIGLAVLLLVSLLSIAGYLLTFWNFRLSQHDEGTLHVSRGLITTRSTSIESRRLRGVEISEPLLLRSVRGARLLAVATGLRVGRGAERGGSMLVPPAPLTDIDRVAGTVLNDAGALAVTLTPRSRIALRRRLLRTMLPCVFAAALSLLAASAWGAPLWIAIGCLGCLLPAAALGYDRFRALGHAVTTQPSGQFLVTRFGSLVRRRVVLDTEGIIGWNIRQTFFQRRAGVVTISATTAAGRQRYPITDTSPAVSIQVARTATPGLLDDFLVNA